MSGGVFLWLLLEASSLIDSRRLIIGPKQTVAGLTGLAVLAFILAALLLDKKIKAEAMEYWGRGRLLLIMAGLLILAVIAVIIRLHTVSTTTCHVVRFFSSPWIEGMAAAALIAGMLVGVGSGRSRGAGLNFIILVPALIAGVTGEQILNIQRSDRPERVTQAIELYRADHGAYPSSLASLTPTYLTFIPKPLTGRDQIWCYQGGPDYYRLGYVYYQRYYDPTFPDPYAEIKIHAAAGQPPPGSWVCDRELERVELTGGL